jgi:hypothetical protein
VDILQHSADFCRARGLTDSKSVDEWLAANHCTAEYLEQLLTAHSIAASAQTVVPGAWNSSLLGYLRWTGDYQRLLERARAR